MSAALGTLAVLLGLAVFGYGVWMRLGLTPTSRGWTQAWQRDERSAKQVLFAVPGGGLLLMAFGLTRYGGAEWLVPLVMVCAVPGVVLVLVAAFGPRPPLWAYPAWAREVVRNRRERWGSARKQSRP